LFAPVALALLLLAPGRVLAHAIGLECVLKGERVEVEAYYDDDTPARQAQVRVLDGATHTLTQGRTDDDGRWSFATPPAGQYLVIVDAGAGHRAERKVIVPARPSLPAPATRSPEPIAATVSEGPGRAEFTGYPWAKVLIGLVVIGGLSGAFLLVSYLKRTGAA
jgi:hypothetical protein